MSTIRRFDKIRRCGDCWYLSYSFADSGWISGWICTHLHFCCHHVLPSDFCHIPEKYW